jgi:predicted phosphodiesterase
VDPAAFGDEALQREREWLGDHDQRSADGREPHAHPEPDVLGCAQDGQTALGQFDGRGGVLGAARPDAIWSLAGMAPRRVSPIALLSDPHGDVDALRSAIDHARRLGSEEIWCLGDLVGDGRPNETIELALQACDVVIAGNHDLVVARRLDEAYVATHRNIADIRRQLSEDNQAILASLPERHANGRVIATHACLDHPTARIVDEYEADLQLALCDERLLAVGHTHSPFAYLDSGRWVADPVAAGTVMLTDRAIICPGSVVAVDRLPATMCLLDTGSGTCSWHLVPG